MPKQTPTSGEKPPFSRIVTPADAGSALQGRLEANAAEREVLAQFNGVASLASLSFAYGLESLPSQRYRLTGEVQAELTQLCGVTLEPVAEHIREAVSLEFWPEHLLADAASDPAEPDELLASDPPEALVNGRIDLGQLAAEIFASAINPYPRKPDAEFGWTDPKSADAGGLKPFAALAQLKSKH